MFTTAIDCGTPIGGVGIVIEHFNSTKLDTVVMCHCKGSDIVWMSVCGSNGEQISNLTSFQRVNWTSGNYYDVSLQHLILYSLSFLSVPVWISHCSS